MSKKFEVGKKYTCRAACDSDCVWAFYVLRRTAQYMTVNEAMTDDRPKKAKIYLDSDGDEVAYPKGRYSMSPILRA